MSFHAVEAGRDETRRGRKKVFVHGKHSRSGGRSTGVGLSTVLPSIGSGLLGVVCPLCAVLTAPVGGALPDRARVTTCTELAGSGWTWC